MQDITLAPRHYAAHWCAVEERRGELLQVVEHTGSQGIKDSLPHFRHVDELDEVCSEVQDGYA